MAVSAYAHNPVQDRPWGQLPPGLAVLIRAENVRLVPEVVREIRRQIPEYGRPLEGGFGVGIQRGAGRALAQFAELIADQNASPEESLRVYRGLGRGEWREGRSLDALQAAYRLGARLAWRRYAQAARRAGMPPTAMAVLAEAIFAHIDELAAASVEGYAEARAESAGTLRRTRRRLVELLAGGATEAVLAEAARAARWELPERIAGVALAYGPAANGQVANGQSVNGPSVNGSSVNGKPVKGQAANSQAAGVLGVRGRGSAGRGSAGPELTAPRGMPWVLAELEGAAPCLFLAEPELPGRMDELAAALGERGAAVGPTVPLAQAPQSLRWARTVVSRGVDGRAGELVRCDRSLSSVLLLGDPELVRLLAARRLAPLDGLTAKRRERVEATLLVWLETSRGSAPEVAERLGLHPQTARQRMRRIEALFGSALSDPDARFEIELALRARALTAPG